ncbi:MAG: peptidylprolyl isomerase, partial [Candidatus Zixiibacteriota bacterium]
YKKHKEQYTTPARAKISYILIKGGRSPEEQEKAFKKAKEVHRKLKPPFYLLKKGEDFSKVAREYSEDEETAAKGGEFAQDVFECRNVLEYITAHGFHKKIFELKPGEISDVFEYNGDYYIVKLRELEERKQKPLSEVNDIIGKELTEQEHQKVMKTWTEDLLKSANLVIYDSVLRTLSMEEEQKKEISGS